MRDSRRTLRRTLRRRRPDIASNWVGARVWAPQEDRRADLSGDHRMLQRIWQTTEPPTDFCVDLQAPMTLLSRPVLAAVRARANWICRNACFVAGVGDSWQREVASERGSNSLATSL